MIVYNIIWIPGKIPSLNELIGSRGSVNRKPTGIINRGKKRNTFQFNKYNEMKQDWTQKICNVINAGKYMIVENCYFSYLIVEKTKKRDPSNLGSAAVKFAEDALIKCGLISGDGWTVVLGITYYWVHKKLSDAGILVCMSSQPVSKEQMLKLLETNV